MPELAEATSFVNYSALALQYKGGKFFLRVVDVGSDNPKRDFGNEKRIQSFTIECAWQQRVNFGNVHIRWVISKTREELSALKKKANRSLDLDPAANKKLERAILKKPKKGSLVGMSAMGYALAHPRQSFQSFASRQTVVKSANPHSQVIVLQEWLGELVAAAADNNRFAALSTFSNPIFSSCLDSEFQVAKNIARLTNSKQEERKRPKA